MQNSFGVCELASFKRRLKQKLNPICNTKCAPTPDEDTRIWTNERAAQPQSPPACTEHAQATRNLPKPLNASATSWMCLLLYKEPAAFSDFLATAHPELLVTLLFLLSHLPHLLSWKPWPSLPWLLLPSLFSIIFPFILLSSAMVTSVSSASQKFSERATGGPEKLMRPINFARAAIVSNNNITQWPYQKAANCWVAIHRIGKMMALLLTIQTNTWGWHGRHVSSAESSNQSLDGKRSPSLLSTRRSLEGHDSSGTVLGPLDSTKEPHKNTSRNVSLVLFPPQLESGQQHQWTSFQPQAYAGWPAPVLYVCV